MAIGAAAASDGRPAGLGLQRRIMLYVAVGLSIMFGVLAFLGLGAIDQATELVFNERLASAHTTASTLERELGGVATDVREEATELFANTDPGATGGAERLLSRFPPGDSSPFFRVSGLWILDSAGRLLSQAGDPGATAASESAVAGAAASVPAAGSAILAAVAPVNGETAFAAVIARLDRRPGEPEVLVVVHTVSINSTADYRPATHGQPVAPGDPESPPHSSASDAYHLEVIDPDGSVVLGIGADERPGQLSRHFQAISSLVRAHGAATLLHEPDPDNPAESHVMAVVPVSETPFYLVLEQPVDIALALPQDLRERLVLTIVLGFVATLAVAWITTRHVVKPTEQLTAAAQRMARGDLDSPIAVAAQDEIGRLAESLDTMRRHLRPRPRAGQPRGGRASGGAAHPGRQVNLHAAA
jgi:HAMP domain-containing protein